MVAKVADLGMKIKAKFRGGVGSPFWMAPEYLPSEGESPEEDKKSMGREADIYSLGITMWEVFTRQAPYEAYLKTLNPNHILSAIKHENLRPDIPVTVPEQVEKLIRWCWHPEPSRRPTIQKVRKSLVAALGTFTQERDNIICESTESKPEFENLALLHKMLPPHVASALSKGQKVEPEEFDQVTIFFSDIVGYTELSSNLPPSKVMTMLDRLYTKMDSACNSSYLYKVETIGDAYMCAGGLPKPQELHALRVALFSLLAINASQNTLIDEEAPDLGCINIRVGFHSGPVVASVVGDLNPRYCLFGDTVNTASRMESNSEKNKINMSPQAHKFLLEQLPGVETHSRGFLFIKGKGDVECFFLESSIENETKMKNALKELSE